MSSERARIRPRPDPAGLAEPSRAWPRIRQRHACIAAFLFDRSGSWPFPWSTTSWKD